MCYTYNMLVSVNYVRGIAQRTRQDFEAGNIDPAELKRAVQHAPGYAVDEFRRDVENALDPTNSRPPFPHEYCQLATIVLRERVGIGKVTMGSYGIQDGGGYDPEVGKYVPWIEDHGPRPHTFLSIGRTSLGPDTICDITGDQFKGDSYTKTAPPVYVGPLDMPWSLHQAELC